MSSETSFPPVVRRLIAASESMTFGLGAVRVTVTAGRRTDPGVMVRSFRAITEFVDPDLPRFGNGRDVRFDRSLPDYGLAIQRRRGPYLCGRDVQRALLAAADQVVAEKFPKPLPPRPVPPEVAADPIRLRAEGLHWQEFEYRVITRRDVSLAWDDELAGRFNRHFCDRVAGCPPKPIVFDFRPGTRSTLGQHCHDRIRLRADIPDDVKWRVLMHELAHYRVGHHRRGFVRELALVYRTWIEFRSGRVTAAVPEVTAATPTEGDRWTPPTNG